MTAAGSNRPEHSPVFLVGCPRSGTTLLQRLLDAHSQVAVAPETHFIRRFWLTRDRYGDLSDDQAFSRLVEDVISMPEFADMTLVPAQFRAAAARIQRSVPAIFGLLLRSFGERRGVPLIGEKTPNHLLYMPTLDEFFPGARFIHLIRDPRAVVCSWKTVPWSTGSIRGDANVWRRYMIAARAHPPRRDALHTVRYEALVSDPEPHLRRICEFLEIAYEPAMLAFHERPAETLDLSREPWKKGATAKIHDEPVHSWRRTLSKAEIAEIEGHVWPEMVRLHYLPATSVVSLAMGRVTRALAGRVTRLLHKMTLQ